MSSHDNRAEIISLLKGFLLVFLVLAAATGAVSIDIIGDSV
jgi:hypothetical protein